MEIGWRNRCVNDDEASAILVAVAVELRRESYDTLVARYLSEQDERTIVAESGVEYRVEVQAFWDTPREPGNLPVITQLMTAGGVRSDLCPRTSSSPQTAHSSVNDLCPVAVARPLGSVDDRPNPHLQGGSPMGATWRSIDPWPISISGLSATETVP